MPKPTNGEILQVSKLPYILKGTVLALAISLTVLLLLTIILFLTPLTEGAVPYVTYITSIFSIIIGAAYASKRIQSKGWLNGGLTGLTYIIILLLLSRAFGVETGVNLHLATKVLLAFALGSIGGILGLNL